MIVARGGNRDAQQILILVNRLDNRGQKQQELTVFCRGLARVEQVLAGVGRDRPVIVLARSVDSRERLFMQQADKAVTIGNLAHELHGQLVVIGGDVGRFEDGRHLVLCRCDLVVLGLGVYAHLPQLLVEIVHERLDTRADGAEIVVFQLLTLGCRRTEQRAAGQNQVAALGVVLFIDEEVFLLRADRGGHALAVLAEQLQKPAGLARNRVHRAQKRGLFVQHLAGVRAERGRDAQGIVLNECVGSRVPSGVAACLEGGTQTARRERGGIRFALDQLLARKLHQRRAALGRGQEGVVLFGCDAGHGLEPVGEVGRALGQRPILHRVCDHVSDGRVEGRALADGLLE